MNDKIEPTQKSDFDLVIENLKKILFVKTDKALSRALGMSDSAIAMSRKKGVLPFNAICNLCMGKGISIDQVCGLVAVEPCNTDGLISMLKIVDLAIVKELDMKQQLTCERKMQIYRQLQPIIVGEALHHGMNEKYIEAMVKGALMGAV